MIEVVTDLIQDLLRGSSHGFVRMPHRLLHSLAECYGDRRRESHPVELGVGPLQQPHWTPRIALVVLVPE